LDLSGVKMDEVPVGGVPVTPFRSIAAALDYIVPGPGVAREGFAVAINAEKVVMARSDPAFLAELGQATLRYADGAPVAWAIAGKGFPNVRIPGVELWEALLTKAGEEGIPVFLLGASEQVHAEAKAKLTRDLSVQIVDGHHGYFDDQPAMIQRIKHSRAKIVSVALGSPKQERFILRCRAEYASAFYMGVGGAYDVYVGEVKRAPKWLGDLGLEWFYRLIKDPSRIRRQRALGRYLWWLVRGSL
jgi:UDP-N-acetyl-D-mannosaminouronate:lipid I N-acetyl-D-mannosaminouronosyltransferase